MQPNTLSQYLLPLIIVILLAFALAYGLQSGLGKLTESTTHRPAQFKPSL